MIEIIEAIILAACCLGFYWWGRHQGYQEGRQDALTTARPVSLKCGGFQILASEEGARGLVQQFDFHVIRTGTDDENRRPH